MKNTKKYLHPIIFFLIYFTSISILTSCTQSDGSAPSKISDSINDVLNPDSTLTDAKNQIAEVQKKLNQDSTYALTQEDYQLLQNEGLVENNSDLKAWVK